MQPTEFFSCRKNSSQASPYTSGTKLTSRLVLIEVLEFPFLHDIVVHSATVRKFQNRRSASFLNGAEVVKTSVAEAFSARSKRVDYKNCGGTADHTQMHHIIIT